MERLTLDKDVKDMGYMDLAHNMTFAKDGEIWYHNFTDEISLRNLIRRLCENFNIDIEKDDDLFDDAMADWLGSEEPGSVESLLALLNFVFIGYDGLRARLKYYEDLAELGRLIELPCKVGDKVYSVHSAGLSHAVITEVYTDAFCLMLCVAEGRFGKTVFLTKEEAEAKLAEM